MESEEIRTCQWKGCGAPASRHVVCGLRVFEAGDDDVHISAAPYSAEHFDLCEKHVERARVEYVHCKEYGFGDCPQHPDP